MFDGEREAAKFMVTIATFNEPAKAKHLKARLEEAGVKADIHNEGRLQQAVFRSTPQANAKVLVAEEDFEEANKLMVEWEASDPQIGSAIRCPQCKSPRIEYPQLTRKFITPWLASILFALKIFPKEFYCQDCHFTWGKDGDPLPRPAAWETFS
jgi:predicted Zn-ribbon and HTH transcriptional regulator